MEKKKKIIIISVIVAVIAITVGVCLLLGILGKTTKLEQMVANTEVKKSKGYIMDLRINGTYNNKKIYKIIMINNYNNTDKQIAITNVTNGADEKSEYVVKDGKYYEVKEDKLKEVNNVLYEDTDVFLEGVKDAKNIKQVEDKKIGEKTYKVYTGDVSKKTINNMISHTDLGFEVDKDATAEIWLTNDNYVYRAYYRIDKLEIYASFYGYSKTSKISLDQYEK